MKSTWITITPDNEQRLENILRNRLGGIKVCIVYWHTDNTVVNQLTTLDYINDKYVEIEKAIFLIEVFYDSLCLEKMLERLRMDV